MVINDPDTLRQVEAAFTRYETALLAHDAATLDAMFLHREDTVRYGVGENQYGIAEIRAFRALQSPFERDLARTVIVTYGTDVATASTLFFRPDALGKIGRQTQTWIRHDGNWLVAAAHVSMIDEPA